MWEGSDSSISNKRKSGFKSLITAYNLLNQYLLGALDSSVPVNQPTGGGGSTPAPQSPPSSTLPASVQAKYPGATIRSQKIEDNGAQELIINFNGACRHIQVSPGGEITSDDSC